MYDFKSLNDIIREEFRIFSGNINIEYLFISLLSANLVTRDVATAVNQNKRVVGSIEWKEWAHGLVVEFMFRMT